jgi:uncharacterized protein DUF6113
MNGRSSVISAGAYVMLFLLGATQGVFGSFQYSRVAPGLAITLALIIGVTCVLAAWGMGSATGAVVTGAGWLLASFVISMPMSNGSKIIVNTSAGEWYLYGGTLTVAVAVIVSMTRWSRGARVS